MRHLQSADPELANELVQKPGEMLPIVCCFIFSVIMLRGWFQFELAVLQLAKEIHFPSEREEAGFIAIPEIQVLLKSEANIIPMRLIGVSFCRHLLNNLTLV